LTIKINIHNLFTLLEIKNIINIKVTNLQTKGGNFKMLEAEEKQEIKDLIVSTIKDLTPAPVEKEKEIEIPVPKPPKTNEDLEKEIEGEEKEEVITTSIFAELWKKIW
jgi:hypothetical protein